MHGLCRRRDVLRHECVENPLVIPGDVGQREVWRMVGGGFPGAVPERMEQPREHPVGFLRPPIPGAGLGLEHVRNERLIAALPEGHRLAGQRGVDLALLADEDFVLYPSGASTSLGIISACNAAGFTPAVTQEATETHTLVCLVAAGLGVSLLPESVRHLKIPGVVYVSLDTAQPPLELWMAWRRDDTSSPVLDNFLTMARTVFAATA